MTAYLAIIGALRFVEDTHLDIHIALNEHS